MELDVIRRPRVKWLTLLAETGEQLAQGRAALLQHQVPFSIVTRRVFTHGTYTLYVELLELTKTSGSD
jgi:hypothetical protein